MSAAVFVLPIRSWKMNGFCTADACLWGSIFKIWFFGKKFSHSCKDMLLALKWLGICDKALWHWTIPPFCRVQQESIRKIRAHPFLCFFDGEKMHLEMQKSEIFTRVRNIKLVLALCCSEEQNWAVSLTAHPFGVSVWNVGASDAKRGAPGGLKATGWKMPSDPFSAAIFRLGIFWKLVCSSVRSSTSTVMLFTFFMRATQSKLRGRKVQIMQKMWRF